MLSKCSLYLNIMDSYYMFFVVNLLTLETYIIKLKIIIKSYSSIFKI